MLHGSALAIGHVVTYMYLATQAQPVVLARCGHTVTGAFVLLGCAVTFALATHLVFGPVCP